MTITGWSPFIPTDADNSSLPVGALEYHFKNTSAQSKEYVFSFNSPVLADFPQVLTMDKGFILSRDTAQAADRKGDLAFFTDDPAATVNYCWFRGGWWDPLTMTWNGVQDATTTAVPPQPNSTGASLYVPFTLRPGEEKTIRLLVAWYVPDSHLRLMDDVRDPADSTVPNTAPSYYHKPWYSSKFSSIGAVTDYWRQQYAELRHNTTLFSDAFYLSTLPPEVIEAVAANLSILKSPTVLRNSTMAVSGAGKVVRTVRAVVLGSCTHVWNWHAQAVCHLFPSLERSLRQTEFFEEPKNAAGHQQFRAARCRSVRCRIIFSVPLPTGSSAAS